MQVRLLSEVSTSDKTHVASPRSCNSSNLSICRYHHKILLKVITNLIGNERDTTTGDTFLHEGVSMCKIIKSQLNVVSYKLQYIVPLIFPLHSNDYVPNLHFLSVETRNLLSARTLSRFLERESMSSIFQENSHTSSELLSVTS